MNPLKHAWDWYWKGIKDSIEPKEYSHQATMDVMIRKGAKRGRALVPCAIYAMDHSIDLNPSLIRKRDKKVVKEFKPGEKIQYDSKTHDVVLTEDEKKKGHVLKELERCDHCGQKLVISEVAQTRYRSCPDIWVTIGDRAKETLHIPVKFGFNKMDIISRLWTIPLLLGVALWITLSLFGYDILEALTFNTPLAPGWVGYAIAGLLVGGIWLLVVPRALYGTYRIFKWYFTIKDTMEKNPYAK